MATSPTHHTLRNRSFAIVLTSVVVAVAVTQLPFRVQGRIVETVTFGEWPLEWALRRHFNDKQPELRSLSRFMRENPEVAQVKQSSSGLRASLHGEPSIGQEYENPAIRDDLKSIQAYWISVKEGRIHVFLGTENRSGVAFLASYSSIDESGMDVDSCENTGKDDRHAIGGCGLILDQSWFIRYLWEPADIRELEELLDQPN